MAGQQQVTISVGDCELVYRRSGSGPTLLFLHGEATTSDWSPFHDELAQSFDVVAPVHPGFGGSVLPDWVDAVDDLAYHYLDVMAALGLVKPLLVGQSLGGWIALQLAVQRPDAFSAVALIGALGLRPEIAAPDLFVLNPPEALALLSNSIDHDAFDPMTGDAGRITELWVEQATQARLMWKRPYDRRFDRRARHCLKPALVLWGDQDRLLPVEHGRRLSALIGAEFATVAGAGHLAAVDEPVASAALIHSWRS